MYNFTVMTWFCCLFQNLSTRPSSMFLFGIILKEIVAALHRIYLNVSETTRSWEMALILHMQTSYPYLHCSLTEFVDQSETVYEPQHDKTNKMNVRPAKTQISLGRSESSLCAQRVAKNPRFLHVDREDSYQTGQMLRLIWVVAGCTLTLLVLSCCGSYYIRQAIQISGLTAAAYLKITW